MSKAIAPPHSTDGIDLVAQSTRFREILDGIAPVNLLLVHLLLNRTDPFSSTTYSTGVGVESELSVDPMTSDSEAWVRKRRLNKEVFFYGQGHRSTGCQTCESTTRCPGAGRQVAYAHSMRYL